MPVEMPGEEDDVLHVSYDNGTKVLSVEFKSHKTLKFFDVPENVYYELMLTRKKRDYIMSQVKEIYKVGGGGA